MNKQNVVEPLSGILLGYKKEWSTDKFYNMDKPWEHSAMGKKPVTEDHMHDSIYTKCQNRKIYGDRKQTGGRSGLEGMRDRWQLKGTGFLFEVMKMS